MTTLARFTPIEPSVSQEDLDSLFGRIRIVTVPFKLAGMTVQTATASGRTSLQSVSYDGRVMIPTSRFTTSFCSFLGQAESIYRLFSPDEVIARALSCGQKGEGLMTIDETDPAAPALLSIIPPRPQILGTEGLFRIAKRMRSSLFHMTYHGLGEFSMSADLSLVHRASEVSGETYTPYVNVRVPVDGWGPAQCTTGLLRNACRNRVTPDNHKLRHSVPLGQECPDAALLRFLSSYGNEEDVSLLNQRMAAARRSPLSLAELRSLLEAFEGANDPVIERARRILQGGYSQYHLASLSAIAPKRATRIHSSLSVAVGINIATELITHYGISEIVARRLSDWVGARLADEGGYDLEGILKTDADTLPFYLTDEGDFASPS